MGKRDAIAKALFDLIYEGSIDDDPTFPDRLWAEMNQDQKRLYYRQADVALAAAA